MLAGSLAAGWVSWKVALWVYMRVVWTAEQMVALMAALTAESMAVKMVE